MGGEDESRARPSGCRSCAHRVAMGCLVAALVHGAASGVDLMPTAELRPGMRGKGRSVFQGRRIEQFDVEIVGVMRDAFGPKHDMIIARADAPALKQGPIAGGMSGSPVYVKGKLIGAIAITWAFAKGGYCGITPIHEMIEDAKSPRPARPALEVATGSVPRSRLADLIGGKDIGETVPGEVDALSLQRILTPVMVSDGSPRLLNRLNPLLKGQGLVLVQSGGAGRAPAGTPRLRPGSAVGVRLIGGDLNYTAIGTVTHIEGDRVLAFGHPLLDEGDMSAPMTAAYVHGVVPSYYYPMKMAVGTDAIGAVDRDRRTVLAGTLNKASATIPCDVTLVNKGTGATHRFHYELLRHRRYTPYLAGLGLATAYDRVAPAAGEFMAELAMTVRMEKRVEPLVLRDRFFGGAAIVWQLFGMAFELAALKENRFEKVRIESLAFDLTVEPGHETALIHSLRIDSRRVKPGAKLVIVVRLRPYRGPELVEKRATLTIPTDVPPGTPLEVVACDARQAEGLKRNSRPGVYVPETLDQLFALVRQLERSDHLIVYAALPRLGVSHMGRALPDLPESLARVMAWSNQTGVGPVRDALIERVPTPWVLQGAARMGILVVEEE